MQETTAGISTNANLAVVNLATFWMLSNALFGGAALAVLCVLSPSSLLHLLEKNVISWNIAFLTLLHIYAMSLIQSQFATSFLAGCLQLPLVTILVLLLAQERINIISEIVWLETAVSQLLVHSAKNSDLNLKIHGIG